MRMPEEQRGAAIASRTTKPLARLSAGQRAVEDQAVAFVVADHGTAFVCVVVRAFHDAATAGLDGLRRGVDVSCLDTDDNLPGHGVSTAVASAIVTDPPSRAAKWAPSRNFSDIPNVSL